jgi:hypothetical protein
MFAVALGLLVERMVPAATFGVGKAAIIGVKASSAGNRNEQDDDDPYEHSAHPSCPSGPAIMLARSRPARNGCDYHTVVDAAKPRLIGWPRLCIK